MVQAGKRVETARRGKGLEEPRGQEDEGAEGWWSPRGRQWGAPKSFGEQEEPTPAALGPRTSLWGELTEGEEANGGEVRSPRLHQRDSTHGENMLSTEAAGFAHRSPLGCHQT